MAETAKFDMTAEHLARTLEAIKLRERRKIAQEIEDRADLEEGYGHHETATVCRELAEQVRFRTVPNAVRLAPAEIDPLTTDIDAKVLAEEGGDPSLPPVRHHDDLEEGMRIVAARSRAARMGGTFPRD